MKEFTEIKITNQHGEYSVRVPATGMTLAAVMEDLVKPVLLAAGYQASSVDQYVND